MSNSSNQKIHLWKAKIITITLIKGEKIHFSSWKIEWSFDFYTGSLQPRMCHVRLHWNRPSGSGEEDFKIFSMYFRSLLGKMHLFLTNLNPLYPMNSVETGLLVLERKLFYRQTDRRGDRSTNDKQQVIRNLTWAFSSREVWTLQLAIDQRSAYWNEV